MGNILSAWPKEESTSGRICFSNWLPLLLTFYFLWGFQVVKWLYDFLVEQPWGMVSERKRMIARAQQKREQGFGEWRARLHGADQQMLNKLKRIATLQLTELRDALQREEITAIDALMAYINKALISQDRINAITEIVKEAYEIAEELDGKWRGKPNKPPLFGVPFSVKSNFHMVGYDCHVGLGKFLEQPMTKECTMVTHLKHLGAVPFCLTNVPQGLLSFVCSNPVYGTTTNPYDQSRSPGGSSGGEGALVADGATPFGTGSDVGGSLRIPAAFCGLVTLKCGQERLVVLHSHGGVPGRGRLGLGFGYFTRTVDEQILLLKDTIGHAHFCSVSPTTPKLPLDLEVIRSTHRLHIGYYEDDGFFKACPAMARAVRETVAKLREQGHEMVKFTVPDPQKMALLVFKNILPDGGVYTRNLYAADVVDKYMTNFVRMLSLPGFVRSLLTLAFKPFSPQASIMCGSTVKDLSDLRKAQEDTDEYKEKFIEYWQELGLDAVVCPSFPAPAVGHEWPSHLGGFAVSTTLYNMLDFPAGVVPVGKATEEDDQKLLDDREYPVGYNIALRYMRSAASRCVGLPISVQVVSLPYKEEVCLRVMGEIEKALPYRK